MQFGDLAPHYDELMQVVPYDDWAEYVLTLFAYASHKPRRILDCACGTGNLSFELARRGFEVVGVDLSSRMIEVAQGKLQTWPATRETAPPRFVQGDLSEFELGEAFDSATCLYDSLNYILDPQKLQAAFARIAHHVKPGGVFVFDMNSEYALTADLFSQCNFNPRKQLHYDWRAQFDEETRICTVNMRFERQTGNGQSEVFQELHRERAYRIVEIKAMLAATGWELLHEMDAYTLNRPHDRSERWYFVVRRS
jgi:ubiquinone/menaquinone biosynthesis C-methylase UbiE